MSDQAAPTGISVHTRFIPLAFILFLVKTRLELDGGPPVVRPWGDSFIPVAPGRHQVRCYFVYLFLSRAGDSAITVDVAPGQVVQLRWRAPWLVFLPGKWEIAAPAPVAAPAPGQVGPGQMDPAWGWGQSEPQAPAWPQPQPQAQPWQPEPQPAPQAWHPQPEAQPPAWVQPQVSPPASSPEAATVTAMTQPANWYADPTGRNELRYWDGIQWTAHVSSRGVTATDPV